MRLDQVVVSVNQPSVFNAPDSLTCDSLFLDGVWYYQSFTMSDTLIGSNSLGCDSIVVKNYSISPSPKIVVSPSTTTLAVDDVVILVVGGASNYVWDDGSTSSLYQNTFSSDTIICVVGTNVSVCGTDTACANIYVIEPISCDGIKIFVPTAFSPNGDGQNDILQLYSTGEPSSILFTVYNRWGQIVFQTNDISRTWDGTLNGNELDAAVFTYTLSYTCKSEQVEEVVSGNISLVR